MTVIVKLYTHEDERDYMQVVAYEDAVREHPHYKMKLEIAYLVPRDVKQSIRFFSGFTICVNKDNKMKLHHYLYRNEDLGIEINLVENQHKDDKKYFVNGKQEEIPYNLDEFIKFFLSKGMPLQWDAYAKRIMFG